MRRVTDEYGLAYMTAKNVIGPVTILLVYAALRASLDTHAMLLKFGAKIGIATAHAGVVAGQVKIICVYEYVYMYIHIQKYGYIYEYGYVYV